MKGENRNPWGYRYAGSNVIHFISSKNNDFVPTFIKSINGIFSQLITVAGARSSTREVIP